MNMYSVAILMNGVMLSSFILHTPQIDFDDLLNLVAIVLISATGMYLIED